MLAWARVMLNHAFGSGIGNCLQFFYGERENSNGGRLGAG